MISDQPTRGQKLVGIAIVMLLLVSVFPASTYAYNDRPGHTHSWLARKSLALLKERRPDIASKFPLDYYLAFMEEGIWYADNTTELVCNWARAVTALDFSNWGKSGDPAVSYACDAFHHYGKLEVIETEKGIDAGHPGAFTGQDYVPALFDVAVAFWPGNDKPVLSQLIKKDAGSSRFRGVATTCSI